MSGSDFFPLNIGPIVSITCLVTGFVSTSTRLPPSRGCRCRRPLAGSSGSTRRGARSLTPLQLKATALDIYLWLGQQAKAGPRVVRLLGTVAVALKKVGKALKEWPDLV